MVEAREGLLREVTNFVKECNLSVLLQNVSVPFVSLL